MVTIAKVRRPLGVILEEREDGRGVEVLDIDPSGNAAGEAACISSCATLVGMPICLSDACYGPNGPDFSPSCK